MAKQTTTQHESYVAREADQRRAFQQLADEAAAMPSYTALHLAAVGEGALNTKVKELMAVAIAIATQCEGCILYHTRNALEAGASSQELYEAANVAIMMAGGPAVVYAAKLKPILADFHADGVDGEKSTTEPNNGEVTHGNRT